MKATLNGTVVADSDDTVSVRGYDYFPLANARLDLLEKSPRTLKDLECPHGVQFYDVTAVTVHYLAGAAVAANVPALYRRFGLPAVTVAAAILLAAGICGWRLRASRGSSSSPRWSAEPVGLPWVALR